MLDELQRQRVGGGGLGDSQHVVGREDTFVGHHRHSRAGAHTRHARYVPGRQRLLHQRHAHVGERRHCTHGGRLVPGLVRVDDQRRAPLERRRDPAQPCEVVRKRLRADLDLEAVVQARRELRLRLLDLLRRVARGERPEDRHPIARCSAQQLHHRNSERAADRVEERALDRSLGGVVALRWPNGIRSYPNTRPSLPLVRRFGQLSAMSRRPSWGAASGFAGQHGKHSADEGVELLHVVLQEFGGRGIADLAVVRDQPRRELDIGFGAFICGELQKLSTLRRLCCATAVPIAPGEVPITADGLRVNEFVP